MDPPKNYCLPAKIGLLIGTKKKFRPLVVLTRLSIAHYFIIMCHLWVWLANNHQWKEETKSYSLHSSKNIPFEKQIIFFAPILSTIKNSNNIMTSLCFILLKFTRFSKQNFQRIVFQNWSFFYRYLCTNNSTSYFFADAQREKKRGAHSTLLTLSFAVDQKCGVKKACLIDAIIIKFQL